MDFETHPYTLHVMLFCRTLCKYAPYFKLQKALTLPVSYNLITSTSTGSIDSTRRLNIRLSPLFSTTSYLTSCHNTLDLSADYLFSTAALAATPLC